MCWGHTRAVPHHSTFHNRWPRVFICRSATPLGHEDNSDLQCRLVALGVVLLSPIAPAVFHVTWGEAVAAGTGAENQSPLKRPR